MDKIKNSALYKKAENMVGAGDGHQGAAHQTGGQHVPGHTGAGVQQGGNYPSTTGTHQMNPSYTGGVGSGAYPSEQHGAGHGGTHTTVYPTDQRHTGQHHTGYGVGAGVGEQGSHGGGIMHEGAGQQPAPLTGVERPNTNYETGTQPIQHGGVAGLKEKVANRTGFQYQPAHNATTEYGTGGGAGVAGGHHYGVGTGAQPVHQGGVMGGLKEKVGNMTGANQHATHSTPAGYGAGGGMGGNDGQTGHMSGVHGAVGQNTGGLHAAPHATVPGQKPTMSDRAKGMLNRAKP
jgi:hypothetical protein